MEKYTVALLAYIALMLTALAVKHIVKYFKAVRDKKHKN